MKKHSIRKALFVVCLSLGLEISAVTGVSAIGSSNPRQSGSTGLQGTISSAPPKAAPTISQPVAGRGFTESPITISGLCANGLLVKIFSNGVFVGGVQCASGSYSLQVGLFNGQNDLTAIQYDALDQASPTSTAVTVNYQSSQFAAFGQPVSLTSQYAKLGADVGTQLTWPLILSGGSGPYAVSVDWGDGTAPQVLSVSFTGQFNITHTYRTAGTFRVTVRVSDSNGQTAFLQLVGVGNGKVAQANQAGGTASGASGGATTDTKPGVVWWPFAVFFPFVILTFWLGQKYELREIHRQLDRHRSGPS